MLRPDELEDATQTVLQRALENMHRFRGDSSPRVWILGIARNVGLEVARARQRNVARIHRPRVRRDEDLEEVSGEEMLTDDGPDQEDKLGRKEQQALALAALDGLSLDDKLALLVTYVDGLSGPEAAEILGVTFVAFRQRLSRARLALREGLKGLLDSGEPGRAEVMSQWRALLDPRPALKDDPDATPHDGSALDPDL